MYESLRVIENDGIGEIVLQGARKGHPMGPEFFQEFPAAVRALDSSSAVRAILVHADGDHFSYGLDLARMLGDLAPMLQGGLAETRTNLLHKIRELQASFTSLVETRKPTIAAIQGWCIGGGVDLITACDIRLASRDARFSVREVKVAMVADLGSLQRLPPIVGEGHARELALTGKDIDAARALRIGLVNDTYDTKEQMVAAARVLAGEIASNPPLVVQGVKEVMNHAQSRAVADGLAYVAAWNSAFLPSEDLTEAAAAFLQKRPAVFAGK